MSRRGFLRGGVATAAVAAPVLRSWGAVAENARGPAMRVLRMDRDWLFGGKMTDGALAAGFSESGFQRVTLPHCVAPLSWRNWDPASWEDVWIYRRHFTLPRGFEGLRVFAHFDRVMEGMRPAVNGHELEAYEGGFLPVEREITGLLRTGDNVLAVAVDGRWLDAPPSGSPKGPESVDYLMAAGVTGTVTLRAVPQVFLRDVFAKPVKVMDAGRRVELKCSVDAAGKLPVKARLEAVLRDGERVIARAAQEASIEKPQQDVELTVEHLGNVVLWDVENPRLYELEVTLFGAGRALHAHRTRVGFRDARFEMDGFYLNGKRLQIFGLNRHEIYPYTGFAMPDRVMRRDAEILRRELNCNMVRCSHYPQSEAFLDACDEL
ncbi:MAG TPA: glycoside hydrolase family 2 TIM barrel-domain containing protein, partial [Terracidiphilus sp.]